VRSGPNRPAKPEETEMTRYLMSVFGPAEYKEYGNYPSEEAMKQALADTGVSTSDCRRRATGTERWFKPSVHRLCSDRPKSCCKPSRDRQTIEEKSIVCR